MHPAYSIIIFTVLSGLGYGLAAVLGLGVLDPTAMSTRVAHVSALGLIGVGLTASTLHLGNPQRAWRALSQWRSSWLSREGVMALVSLIPLTISAVMSVFWGQASLLNGIFGAVFAFGTVYCTSMIYASLKSVDAWHTTLTSACYLAFAVSGGLIAAGVCAAFSMAPGGIFLALAAALALATAWILKIRWRQRLKSMRPTSTAETATGLSNLGKVRLFEPPHMTDNYLTREMGFKIARKHADKLFAIALFVGGVLPILLLVGGVLASLAGIARLPALLYALALAAHLLGLVVERWLFFAEARHSVMSYYGS